MGGYAESLIAKGRAVGRAEWKTRALFVMLAGRGIPVSDEARDRILSCYDHDMLNAWVLRAISAETAEALFDGLAEEAELAGGAEGEPDLGESAA
ncbi:hypothetical protein Nocox_09050 [Nonomuraea coxensis DSM 45129]|uniref:Transposase n=2 Tax=Nonomuraea coxensis TaxID=404386 RepID=A0ABX8TY13_9ACTN|nr:hypothetical protein Nocox_09050 [Nonomuraea coxensis DSM 45129]